VQAQQAGEHVRWRRQGQRDTYAAFIAAVEQVREHANQVDAQSLEAASRAMDDLAERVDAVIRALPMVMVEGPDEVVAAAEELRDTSCEIAMVLMSILDARRSRLDVTSLRKDLVEQQNWLDGLIAAFAVAVRKVLDLHPAGRHPREPPQRPGEHPRRHVAVRFRQGSSAELVCGRALGRGSPQVNASRAGEGPVVEVAAPQVQTVPNAARWFVARA
jgi:hypothetical protein